jgi:hypothetical protein
MFFLPVNLMDRPATEATSARRIALFFIMAPKRGPRFIILILEGNAETFTDTHTSHDQRVYFLFIFKKDAANTIL